MSQEIHAVLTDDNARYVYRVWSTAVDAYVTDDLTEEGLRRHLLVEAIADVVERIERETGARIERAKARGTSSRVGSKPLDRWEIERTEEV